jgi:hypothetical protein
MILQIMNLSLLPGLLPLLLGNLFLLVSGYDHRVDFERYHPEAEWVPAPPDKLEELIELDRKIRRWDRSILDVSNWLGGTILLLLVASLGLLALVGSGLGRILALDAGVLLIPHWMTGVRRVLTQPELITQVETIRYVLASCSDRLHKHRVRLLMLLQGQDAQVPRDLKFKVDIQNSHPDFLGLYGQVVLNKVQGSSYPYFYVVLVGRRGFGLPQAGRNYTPGPEITVDLRVQEEVEVFVIRQRTTRTSGYHTKPEAAKRLLAEGLNLAEQLARGGPTRTKTPSSQEG